MPIKTIQLNTYSGRINANRAAGRGTANRRRFVDDQTVEIQNGLELCLTLFQLTRRLQEDEHNGPEGDVGEEQDVQADVGQQYFQVLNSLTIIFGFFINFLVN